ncbi:hypothetical protein LIER_33450 [Lithospermum erythrorhizon]|uniref:Uncharacterized protein n=1 Tax=Lithospermum erythrorhizon TaxID=34254 RepID=A0AAV3S0V3_LITER
MHEESEEVEKFGEFSSQNEQAKAIITMRSGKLLHTGAHADKNVAVNGRTECQVKQRKTIEEEVSLEEEKIEELVKPYVPPNIPAYATFIKELIGKRRKYDPNERIRASEMANAVFITELASKLKDPGRPFMASTNTSIEVRNGKISLRILDQVVNIYVFNSCLSNGVNACFLVDELSADVATNKDELNLIPTSVSCCTDTGQKDERCKGNGNVRKLSRKTSMLQSNKHITLVLLTSNTKRVRLVKMLVQMKFQREK